MVGTTIATFAILDLETTGLNSPNITELCIYAISKESITTSREMPRIVHKLNLIFNPDKAIEPEIGHLSGLTNESIAHENSLSKYSAQTLVGFLKHVPQPVCLVAHNGSKYHFAIIKRQLAKVKASLPKDLLYLDPLPMLSNQITPPSYKLEPIYKTLLQEVPVRSAQTTERNVQMLTTILQQLGAEFVNYAYRNATTFTK